MRTGVVLLRVVADAESPDETLVLDAASLVALGQALSWRKAPGSKLVGLAAGPPAWEPALREAIALGADEASRVWSDALAGGDLVVTGGALAAAIPPDAEVVFAGSAAGDHGSGALPAALAEALGWPLLAEVTAVEVIDGVLQARVRERASRRRTYRVDGPAVLAAAQLPPPPLYPPLVRRLQARSAVIAETPPPASDPVAVEGGIAVVGYGPARPRTSHLFQPQASASAADRLRSLMGGGMAARSGAGALKADGDDGVVKQLVDLLAAEGLLEQL